MTSLLPQTARYLLKGLLAAWAGKAPPGGSTGYLARLDQELSSRCPAKSVDCWADPGGWLLYHFLSDGVGTVLYPDGGGHSSVGSSSVSSSGRCISGNSSSDSREARLRAGFR